MPSTLSNIGLVRGSPQIGTSAAPTSRTDPNVANRVDHWLRTNWPELVELAGVWFTGSSVWSFLYGEQPKWDADLDVIAESDGAREAVKLAVERMKVEPPPGAKTATSLGGERIWTTRGSIDLWKDSNPLVAIRNYMVGTHDHARVAYSPRDKVMLLIPNDAATPGA